MKLTDLCCTKCGRGFTPSFPGGDDDLSPPDDGVIFHSYGNYGSRLYDEPDSSRYIVIIICDQCLEEEADLGNVIYSVQPRYVSPARELSEWHPGRGETGGIP